jgi:hypothetical protein
MVHGAILMHVVGLPPLATLASLRVSACRNVQIPAEGLPCSCESLSRSQYNP